MAATFVSLSLSSGEADSAWYFSPTGRITASLLLPSGFTEVVVSFFCSFFQYLDLWPPTSFLYFYGLFTKVRMNWFTETQKSSSCLFNSPPIVHSESWCLSLIHQGMEWFYRLHLEFFLLLLWQHLLRKEVHQWKSFHLSMGVGMGLEGLCKQLACMERGALTGPVLSNGNCDFLHFKSHAQMVSCETLWVIVAFWGYDISGWNSIKEIRFQLKPWNTARQPQQCDSSPKKIGLIPPLPSSPPFSISLSIFICAFNLVCGFLFWYISSQ